MRIAHFNQGIYLKGGMGTYIEALVKLQIEARNDITLFEITETGTPPNGLTPIRVSNEIELFAACTALSIDILHCHTGPRVMPPEALKVVYTVHEHSPHCISGGLFLKRAGRPCPRTYNPFGCLYGHIWDRCGSVRPAAFLENFSRMRGQMKILPRFDVICVGHFLKTAMVRAGYPANMIVVIPNFTDIEGVIDEPAHSGPPQFLFLGRLGRLKGCEWLLRAAAIVTPNIRFKIAGDGPDEVQLRALAAELGIADRVTFLGWVDRNRKQKLITASRAVVVPSLWHESFGLVAIEAAACGRAVIVSNAGELPFIVKNEDNGLVVEAGDVPGLATAIQALADDAAGASAMGRRNYQYFRKFYTAEAHIRAIDRVYAQALARSE